MRQILLQNASGFLLEMQQLLQNATVITNCDNVFTKCDSYYKMLRLLQITTVQRAEACVSMFSVMQSFNTSLNHFP